MANPSSNASLVFWLWGNEKHTHTHTRHACTVSASRRLWWFTFRVQGLGHEGTVICLTHWYRDIFELALTSMLKLDDWDLQYKKKDIRKKKNFYCRDDIAVEYLQREGNQVCRAQFLLLWLAGIYLFVDLFMQAEENWVWFAMEVSLLG